MTEVVVVGAWMDSPERIAQTKHTIQLFKELGLPVCLVAHCPAPAELQSDVDYFIFDKRNVLSTDFRLTFQKTVAGVSKERVSTVGYHAVACLMNIRNAVNLLKPRFTHMHYIESDIVVDLPKYLTVARSILGSAKGCFIHAPGIPLGYRTDLFSADISWYSDAVPDVTTWDEYVAHDTRNRPILEQWIVPFVASDTVPLPKFSMQNMWSQSEYGVNWDD